MSRGQPPKRRHGRSVRLRRSERELMFWTAQQALNLALQALWLICALALTIYFVSELIHGNIAGIGDLLDIVEKLVESGSASSP